MALRKGEKVILLVIGVITVAVLGTKAWLGYLDTAKDPGVPFYSTASQELVRKASVIYRDNNCKSCHTMWTIRDMLQAVPAPALDGIGSIRDEQWLFSYFSASEPQTILPSRLKKEFRMPSYAHLPEQDRRILASYMSSLKVKDWYLEEAKRNEYEKLTGKQYHP